MRLLQPTGKKTLSTPHFQFVSDGTSAGDAAVVAMQTVCEQDYATLKSWYGGRDIPGLPAVVTVDPSAGGAYHQTCEDTGIHLIPDDAPSLLVAELIECFQALDSNYNCGQTDGEGLSRAAAITIRPFQVLTGLDGDVPGWWNNGSPTDFVNDNSQDDQNQQANACGTLFIFWLKTQKGHSWQSIVAAKGATLGDKYTSLSGFSGASGFSDFVADLKAAGAPNTSDNPFPVNEPNPGPPNPTPSPTPQPMPDNPNIFVLIWDFIVGIWRTIFG